MFHWGGALIHNIWKVQDFLVKKNIQVPLSPDLFFLLPKLKQALVGLTGLQRLSLHHNSFDRKAGRDLRAALLSSLPSLSIYGLDDGTWEQSFQSKKRG